MRVTKAILEQRIEHYEKTYGFTDQDGWNQIIKDLKPPPIGSCQLPRAVAYGMYAECLALLGR